MFRFHKSVNHPSAVANVLKRQWMFNRHFIMFISDVKFAIHWSGEICGKYQIFVTFLNWTGPPQFSPFHLLVLTFSQHPPSMASITYTCDMRFASHIAITTILTLAVQMSLLHLWYSIFPTCWRRLNAFCLCRSLGWLMQSPNQFSNLRSFGLIDVGMERD